MKTLIKTYSLYLAWFIVLVGVLVSLYLSEIMHLPPCVLCWYQRVLFYPLLVILTVAIIKKEKFVNWYVLPFSITGLLIALYHSLLQWGIIPDDLAPCAAGISCTTKQIEYLGFITIPFMSLVGFAVVTAFTLLHKKLNSPNEPRN